MIQCLVGLTKLHVAAKIDNVKEPIGCIPEISKGLGQMKGLPEGLDPFDCVGVCVCVCVRVLKGNQKDNHHFWAH